MPITLEIRSEWVKGFIPLSLHVAWRNLRRGVSFEEVLNVRVDIYRVTSLYDGKVIPYHALPGWRDERWDDLLRRLRLIFDGHAAEPTSEAFEREGYELLWPVLEPALERGVAQWPRIDECPYGFFNYNPTELKSSPTRALVLHMTNPFAPASPFADLPARARELRRLVADATRVHPDVTQVTTGSWLNSFKPFLNLFPPQWAASATPSTTPFLAGGHWWGQFYDRRGGFHRKNAGYLRQTGEFPYPPMDCHCQIDTLLAFLEAGNAIPKTPDHNSETRETKTGIKLSDKCCRIGRSATHRVSSFETLDYGADTVRIGDLNGDGAPDLLFTQSVFGQRAITCLTAVTIFGEKLWQVGTPSAANGRVYSDLPVQIYDWDHDGQNEVLYIRQARYVDPILYNAPAYYRDNQICERARCYEGDATMVVLDSLTGKEKYAFPLPAPADDSFLFADLTGCGRREDLVVKDRYWNMWGVSHAGEVLWHWKGSTGHYPAIADVDGDGRDEVFVGCALIDHDGVELYRKKWDSWGDGVEDAWGVPVHQNAAHIVQRADGSWRLLFANGGLHGLAVNGTELWYHPVPAAQHLVAGRYRPDSDLQIAVLNRSTPNGQPADLLLYDVDGREIWRRPQLAGGWCAACRDIRWSGHADLKEILVYNRGAGTPVAIYDGEGNVVASFPDEGYCHRANLWGDSREEVMVAGRNGVRIYANSQALAIPTLYNNTLYHGM